MNKYEKYVKPRFLEIADMCRAGMTDEEIFNNLNISRGTFYKFIKEYPEFDNLMINARIIPYILVENELFKNAVGYDTTETQRIYNPDGKLVSEKIITKHIQGDLSSQKFVLTNRQRDRWDKIEKGTVEFTSTTNKIDLSGKSTDDLIKIIEAAKNEDNKNE